MSDQFPLRPDADWYKQFVERYGDAVPPIEHMLIRRSLQPIVEAMFAQFADLGILDAVEVYGIETRSAAFAIIGARYKNGIAEDDRIALDCGLEAAQERLAEACEHCGKPGEVILKVGLEARLADPDVELGDRLLCRECYELWGADR